MAGQGDRAGAAPAEAAGDGRRRYLGGILLAAAAIRGSLFLLAWRASGTCSVFHGDDTAGYLDYARFLWSRGPAAWHEVGPGFIRTPGYPLLLVPGLALNHPEAVTVLLQIALSTWTIYVVYRISLAVFESPRAALLAAALYAVEPTSVTFSCLLWSETLAAALVSSLVLAGLRYQQSGRGRWLAAAALLAAVSVYVRPGNIYLPFLLLPVFALAGRRLAVPWSRVTLQLLLYLLVFQAPLAAWRARNEAVGNFRGFSTVSAYTIFYWNAAGLVAREQGIPWEAAQQQLQARLVEHLQQLPWDPADRRPPEAQATAFRGTELDQQSLPAYRFMEQEGKRLIRQDLKRYALVHARGMIFALSSPGTAIYPRLLGLEDRHARGLKDALNQGLAATLQRMVREHPAMFVANAGGFGWLLLLYCGAVAGLPGNRRPVAALLFLGVPIAYFVLLSGGPNGDSRFRHPIMPYVCVLAAWGWTRLAARAAQAQRQTRPAAVGA